MCLSVLLRPEASSKQGIGVQSLADASGLHVRKVDTVLGRSFELSAFGACSCDLMTEDQPGDSEMWHLDSERLQNIAFAVAALAKETRNFVFCVHWLGENLVPPQPVKLQALIQLIQSNAIGRNVPYLLGTAHV